MANTSQTAQQEKERSMAMLVFWGAASPAPWVEPDGFGVGVGYPHLQKQRVQQYILSTKLGRYLYGSNDGSAATPLETLLISS